MRCVVVSRQKFLSHMAAPKRKEIVKKNSYPEALSHWKKAQHNGKKNYYKLYNSAFLLVTSDGFTIIEKNLAISWLVHCSSADSNCSLFFVLW